MNKQFLLIIGCLYMPMVHGESLLLQSHLVHQKNPASTIRTLKNKPKLWVFNQKNMHTIDKQEVEQILASFAAVMQCFFNIVQEPKNKQKIALNVANMFLNFLNASKVIIKESNILVDADKQKVRDLLTLIERPSMQEVSTTFAKTNV